ncbi:hypothetical protein SLEP1_g59524 [Rubroshorea leprosula]|uniref:Uncharacterized protein n=1 Tax=Rubroshorea leprosula TaxID=152421 RepID=A0AAV5MTQ2_9ROSI|nr:hypothetical protein SLEP1_g59524 [Rubroshorea leprosula]
MVYRRTEDFFRCRKVHRCIRVLSLSFLPPCLLGNFISPRHRRLSSFPVGKELLVIFSV